MRPLLSLILVSLIAAIPCKDAVAQAPAPAPKVASRITNGDFSKSAKGQNLWSGVDNTGILFGAEAKVNLLTLAGGIGEVAAPGSVTIADMNGDGLQDIVTADAQGYIRIFFNGGTANDPKFGMADVVGVYLGVQPLGLSPTSRLAPRISVVSTGGRPDILVGNYNGEIFLLRNEGTALLPIFRQPLDISKILIPTTVSSARRWGNVFAPVMFDWNKDGKLDMLIGEGSYSANNIHLAINQGSSGVPKFIETQRTVLAFGDGREQLTPALVDYNGDGNMDLLISARDGKVAVHLNPGQPWKPGDELPFSSFVGGDGGKELTFGGVCTIAAGDLNGDGMFDLIAGRQNGKVAIALNTGTAKEPKFAASKDLKSTVTSPVVKAPTGWELDIGLTRGNVMAVAQVVNGADDPNLGLPEGKSALRVGYAPNNNKILPPPYISLPAIGNFNPANSSVYNSANNVYLDASPSNFISIRQNLGSSLKPGVNYTVSMRVKGTRVTGAHAAIVVVGTHRFGADKVQVGERGRETVVERNRVAEPLREVIPMSPATTWTDVTKSFSIKFGAKELNEAANIERAVFEIRFQIAPGAGEFFVTDITMAEG